MNKNRWILSLAVLCFVFNFNSRKWKQTLIVFHLWYKIKFENKQAKNIFHLKSKLNQIFCYSLAWSANVTSGIRKFNSASNYVLIFGKLFPYWLKTKNINSLIFISTRIKYQNVNDIFLGWGFKRKEKGLLYIDVFLDENIV